VWGIGRAARHNGTMFIGVLRRAKTIVAANDPEA